MGWGGWFDCFCGLHELDVVYQVQGSRIMEGMMKHPVVQEVLGDC